MNESRMNTGPQGFVFQQWFDFYKNQCAFLLEMTNVIVAGSEQMRHIQLDTVHRTQKRHQHTQDTMQKAKDMQELSLAQNSLLRDYWQDSMQYWADLAKSSQETQLKLIKTIENCCGEGLPLLSHPQIPENNVIEVFTSAMQSAFDASRKANNALRNIWESHASKTRAESTLADTISTQENRKKNPMGATL